ncbi:MAG: copper chaperone PCu(A)C [Dermatophilaceae bacterium]|nr:copper chaperone PCu(A)C [Intrasporangiaceae bacterium]
MSIVRTAALAAAAALALSGCGDTTTTTPAATATTAIAADPASAGLTLVDGWAKAVEEVTEDGMGSMTGVFGTLTNSTDADIHLTGGSSPAASMVELHETVMSDGTMVMREAADGFVVPAGGTFVLEPGANHVMLLGLTAPVRAGSDVEVLLTAEDGSEVTVVVAARTFAGGEETYAPGEEMDAPMTSTATPTS